MASIMSLTDLERRALPELLNLADGHTRPDVAVDVETHLLKSYRLSVKNAEDQLSIEREFLSSFFEVGNQKSVPEGHAFLTYSASSAMQAAANYCFLENLSVALIEPAFDNIARSLELMKINPVPISENSITGFIHNEESINQDVIWLVLPNNPTGFQIDSIEFEKLSNRCKEQNKLLILDFCFRQFSNLMLGFDQYEILDRAKCRYIGIEDTGKTWASQELKVGLSRISSTSDSANLRETLRRIHENLLLRVSPFVLKLLTAIIQDGDGLKRTKNVLKENFGILKNALDPSCFVLSSAVVDDWPLPMEWLGIRRPNLAVSADEFCSHLKNNYSVLALPGEPFYWRNSLKGSNYIRLSVNRKPDIVKHCADKINKLSDVLGQA